MSSTYEAVILAAGRGSRLGPATSDLPKSLLPLGPRSLKDPTETCFLRRQCELLRQLDVERIAVVVAFKKELMISAIQSWNLGVEIVENKAENIALSGSLHSFQFAQRAAGLGILDGTRQTLLMDADIVYDRKVLARFLNSKEQSALLVSSSHRADSEEVVVYGTEDAPRFLGKGLTPFLCNGLSCLGEATGIVKFAPQDHELAVATMNWLLGDPSAPAGSLKRAGFGAAKQATEHEELTQRFMHYGKMKAITFNGELRFMEVDSPDEYEVMRKTFYPALLKAEEKEP